VNKLTVALWFVGVGSVVGGCFALAPWLGLIVVGAVLAGHAWACNEIQHRKEAQAKEEAK
jgi:hypothetical protein